jgi:hypothetical protein
LAAKTAAKSKKSSVAKKGRHPPKKRRDASTPSIDMILAEAAERFDGALRRLAKK